MTDHFCGEPALPHERDNRFPVQRKGRGSVRPETIEVFVEMIALPRPAPPTRLALAAPVVGRHYLIAFREGFDIRSGAFHDPARLVSQNHRAGIVLPHPDIRVTDSAGDGFYQYFVRAGFFDVNFLDNEFRGTSKMHCRLYFHRFSSFD
jgi:hypothetical protein